MSSQSQAASRSAPAPSALEALMVQVGTGDREALALVYDATASRAFGLAFRVVRDRSHAEDVTQEAYLDIWRKGANFDPERGTALGWIFMVVHGKAVNFVRSAQSRSKRDEVYFREARHAQRTASEDPTGDYVLATSESRRVRLALAQLTAIQRESVELAYFGGYTCTEIALMTEVPQGTAKSRMRDGLITLRDLMGAPDKSTASPAD